LMSGRSGIRRPIELPRPVSGIFIAPAADFTPAQLRQLGDDRFNRLARLAARRSRQRVDHGDAPVSTPGFTA
jgi:hypothetical protein